MLDIAHLPAPGLCVVVAVSGGADSLALWDLLVRAGRWPLCIWHLDHGLRPESAADAELIRARAAAYATAGVATSIAIERADIAALARAQGLGVEDAGRRERYARVAACARRHGATTVVTAHHEGDQAETILFRILRGTGARGLAGMAQRRALAPGIALVRPLLHVPPTALRAHLRAEGLTWHDDASNADPRFARNRLRHAVLPQLEALCPGFAATLIAAGMAAGRRAAAAQQRAAPILAGFRLLPALPAQAARPLPAPTDIAGVELDLAALIALDAEALAELWLDVLARCGLSPDRARLRRLTSLLRAAPGTQLRLRHVLFTRTSTSLRAQRTPWTQSAQPSEPGSDTGDTAFREGDSDADCDTDSDIAADITRRHAAAS